VCACWAVYITFCLLFISVLAEHVDHHTGLRTRWAVFWPDTWFPLCIHPLGPMCFYARQHIVLSTYYLRQFSLSVRPSVAFWYCTQTNEDRIMWSSLWGSKNTSFLTALFLWPFHANICIITVRDQSQCGRHFVTYAAIAKFAIQNDWNIYNVQKTVPLYGHLVYALLANNILCHYSRVLYIDRGFVGAVWCFCLFFFCC